MKTFLQRPTLRLCVVAVLAALITGSAGAQDIRLPPTYGSVALEAGFLPDPYVVNLVAGGPIHTQLGGVNAYVANPPDFKLYYTAGSFPLSFRVTSSADTTLLINLPNGQWVANDDSMGLNPMIRLPYPMSGRYDIFVGTFGPSPASATLFITERTPGPTPVPVPQPQVPNINLPPTYGSVTLQAGFTPDPYLVNLMAGGPIHTNLGGVNAHVANPPDFKLYYTAGSWPLTFHVQSSADTTLLINLPNGQWVANDDSMGLNPMIRLPYPMSGRYDIYVGTFGPTPAPATLHITELR